MANGRPSHIRKWPIGLVLLLCGLLASGGCARKPPPLPRLAPEAVVLAFGDSLTYGSGAGAEESYPAALARLIGRPVVNAGIPGELSAEGLVRLPRVLDEQAPQLLILCHGGNDLLRRVDESETARNLLRMVQLARSRGIAVVLIGVPRAQLGLPVPAFYPALAQAEKLPYAGKILAAIEGDRALKDDPVHPNAAGYRRLAGEIAALLRTSGAL
jgi:lysophospholipase L1-like esterase